MPTTLDAVDLPFTEAIDFFRQKTRLPSAHWSDVWKEAHSRAFMVAGAASDALLSDFQQAVQKALKDGTTLEAFRRDFDAIVARHGWTHAGEPGWRAQIIYETNLATAYSAGRYAQMTDPDVLAAYPYWEYRHTPCRYPRLMHLAWDGTTLKADDPWWDAHYPPNGWRCGCRVQVVSDAGLKRMGRNGPDPSPPTVTQPWTNPRTGEVHQVPVGIDPGFDYNMGKAWQAPVRGERLRPATPGERQPSDVTMDRFREWLKQPRGDFALGDLAPALRAALPGAPATAVLPGAEVRRSTLTAAELLLVPLLLGDGAEASAIDGGVLTAIRLADRALVGRLVGAPDVAELRALRLLALPELQSLLDAGAPVGGAE